jgi:hypothetical protein
VRITGGRRIFEMAFWKQFQPGAGKGRIKSCLLCEFPARHFSWRVLETAWESRENANAQKGNKP